MSSADNLCKQFGVLDLDQPDNTSWLISIQIDTDNIPKGFL